MIIFNKHKNIIKLIMENTEKSTLAKKYTRITGLTNNIDLLIANATTTAEKEKLYKKLIWTIPDGCIDEGEGIMPTLIAEFKSLLATALSITTSGGNSNNGSTDNGDSNDNGDSGDNTNEGTITEVLLDE